jgi:tetratricopeptide (TPR) repeat protein
MGKNFRITLFVLTTLCISGCKSAKQYTDRGNQLFAGGKYEDASINYRNAIKKDPRSSDAYYHLGLSLLKQGKAGEAFQDLNQAVTLGPQNVPAKVELAGLCLAAYSSDPRHPAALYNQARKLTDELLAANANSMEGLRLKGAIALLDNHPGDAVGVFRHALEIAPDNPEAVAGLAESLLRDNQPEEGERTAREAIARHPQYTPAYELLYSYYGTQQSWDKLEALLKLWIANNPKEATPVLRLAGVYYRQKKNDDAEKTLNTLVDRRADFPQADLLAGDFHAVTRNWDKALADYQRGQARDQTREAVYRERTAGMLAASGRLDDSLKALDGILVKDPKNLFARTLKVEILDQKGGAENLKTAGALASDLAKDAPANVRIQLIAGQTLVLQGNLDQASARFLQAAKADDRSIAPHLALARLELLRKNYASVLEHANTALALRSGDLNARLFRIIGLTGTGSYEAAKAEAEQLARDTKNAPQVEMQLGVIALGQKRYSEAENYFRKLYSERAGDIQPLAGLVNTYVAEHLTDRALELVQAEAQRAPDSKGKAALLVATAEAAGKPELALSELQKMAAQNPESAPVQIRIAQVQQQRGNLADALKAFEKARQLDPQLQGLDAAIASLQDQLGQYKEAMANYRKALAKTPDNAVILNNLAFLLAETGGDLNEALKFITTAIRKAPDNSQLKDTLAWIDIKRHDTATALPILENLASKYPDEANFHYHYAVALLASGDRSGAKEQAQAALSDKPSSQTEIGIRGLLAQVK